MPSTGLLEYIILTIEKLQPEKQMITRIILFQCRVNGKIVNGKACINDLLAEKIKHKRG